MVNRGWNVTIAYFKDNYRNALPFINEKINTFKIEKVDCDEFHANLQDSSLVKNALKQCVQNFRIDVVINQWWPLDYVKGIKDVCNVKVVKCLHTAFYRLPLDDPNPLRRMAKTILKQWYVKHHKQLAIQNVVSFLPYVDKYVFLSSRFQDDFLQTSGLVDTEHLLASIPNPTVFESYFDMNDYSEKEKIVLLVGRMVDPPKKITRAIKSWKAIESDEKFKDWKFILVGEGPDLPRYKRLARKYDLKRIYFEGYQQPRPYYKKASIFLMTSSFEGFGMTLVESHQNAVVPIAMDSFLSLHDIIENEENGLIVKDGDIDGLIYAMKRLMADNGLRRKLAEKGLETCQKFNVKKVVDLWEQLILGLNKAPD